MILISNCIVLIAAFLPHIDLLISLVGSLLGSALAFIFPAAIHTAAFWPELVRGECAHARLENSLNSSEHLADARHADAHSGCCSCCASQLFYEQPASGSAFHYVLLARNVFIALFGLLGLLVGSYSASRDIFKQLLSTGTSESS